MHVRVPTHSEGQTNQNVRVCSRKVLQGHTRRISGSCSRDTKSWMVFRDEFLWAKFWVRDAGCVTFFRLVGGEVAGGCSRTLVLSLKMPSSPRLGTFVPQKNSIILLCISLPKDRSLLLFLGCFSVSAFVHFPDYLTWCLTLP